MLIRFAYRLITQVSRRLLLKAGYLWAFKGIRAVSAYQRLAKRGQLFPPFLFLALTDDCNLRCRGCWIHHQGAARHMPQEDVNRIIAVGKRHKSHFYTLLGGEPMMHDRLWEIIEQHPDCYFQIITNGTFLSEDNVQRIRRAGNVTISVSIDGWKDTNDDRRGSGVFGQAIAGLERLQNAKILFGVATTATGQNMDQVLNESYVRYFANRGAMYLWYYIYRPVGEDPSPQYCLGRDRTVEFRKRLLSLRRNQPIILIDTYWNANGEAVCPAALGLGFHIGPLGDINPCPPLAMACDTIRDNNGDLFQTINESKFLRGFQKFAKQRTKGCVILEHPEELAQFFRDSKATDYSGRDMLTELYSAKPRTSHHAPGEEMPEDTILYRFLKKQLFFGLGGYG